MRGGEVTFLVVFPIERAIWVKFRRRRRIGGHTGVAIRQPSTPNWPLLPECGCSIVVVVSHPNSTTSAE